MREQLQERAKLRGVFRGIGFAALFVVINGAVALNFIPSSYQQFTWQAYAGVIYTETATATATSTATSTATATATNTATSASTPTSTGTPVADGGSCLSPTQCQSGFCVEGTCCDTICNQPMQTCGGGTCVSTAAPAPVVSHRTLLLIVALLAAIGFFALTPLRFGKGR